MSAPDYYGHLRDITETYLCTGHIADALRVLYTYRDLAEYELREAVRVSDRERFRREKEWVAQRIRDVKKVL